MSHAPIPSQPVTALPASPRPSPVRDALAALRPRQWTKNLVVLAGLLFSGKMAEWPALAAALAAFACFCLISSVGYLVNDVIDREKDRAHPVKCRRPIAAGRLRPADVLILAGVLAAAALAGAWLVLPAFAAVALAYLLLTFAYTLYWKHQVILDLLAITGGFLLRALAGTVVLGVTLSPWLFVCVSLLALLLGLGKRRHELGLLEEESVNHRPVLADYSRQFLDQALTMAASSSVVSYAVYCISSPTAEAHHRLVFTVPLVIYGVLRYLYLVLHHNQGGQPEEMLLGDRPLLATVVLWMLAVVTAFLWR